MRGNKKVFLVVFTGLLSESIVSHSKEEMLSEEHNISPENLDIFTLVDTSDEAVDSIVQFYSRYLLSPNF